MTAHSSPLVWTIGSGGLVGSAIQRQARNSFASPTIPWHSSATRNSTLLSAMEDFFQTVANRPWGIIWAAGSGTVGSDAEQIAQETEAVRAFAEALAAMAMVQHSKSRGVAMLISSAGGVYAGSPDPPYSVHSPTNPISTYGSAKLTQEQMWRGFLDEVCATSIIRLSNIYGPGQRLTKRQGLISQLAYAAVTRQPLEIFVPLGTVRDYLHADDAAVSIHRLLNRCLREHTANPKVAHTAIVASGEGTSIASLIRMMTDISHRKIPTRVCVDDRALGQALDSRFIPTAIPGEARPQSRPLPVGLGQVYRGVISQLQEFGFPDRLVSP